jgi:hypothetical protein
VQGKQPSASCRRSSSDTTAAVMGADPR